MNNQDNFDKTSVNSFSTPQSGLNSPLLNLNDNNKEQKNSIVSGMSFNSNGEVAEIKLTESKGDLCPFCGFKLSKSSSMCMHCGKILGNAINEKDAISISSASKNSNIIYEDIRDTNPKPIYIVSIVLFTLSLIGIVLSSFLLKNVISTGTLLLISLPSLLISFFYIIVYQLLLQKAGLPWWGIYIPIYNIFLISKLMTNRYLYILRVVIPSIVLSLLEILLASSIMLYFYILSGVFIIMIGISMLAKMSERFNVKFVLLLFFPYIMLPIMGFSKRIVCF